MMAEAQDEVLYQKNEKKEDDIRFSSDEEVLTREEIISNITRAISENKHFKLEENLKSFTKSAGIYIGVIGSTCVGKSSFINNMLGIEEDEEGAAEIGDGDTTQKPTLYRNPRNGQIKFYDLPGFGTASFKTSDKYLKMIDVDKLDLFLVLYDATVTPGVCWIIKKLLGLEKKFALVRTRADDMVGRKGKTLQECIENAKMHCKESMIKNGITDEVPIFVISNIYPEIGDFDELFSYIEGNLSEIKRVLITLHVNTLTDKIIRKKKIILMRRAWDVAASMAISASFISFATTDISSLVTELEFYLQTFGLTGYLLQDIPLETRKCLKTSNEIERMGPREYINLNIKKAPEIVSDKIVGDVINLVLPIVGSMITGGTAYRFYINFLRDTIQKLAAEAKLLRESQLESMV